MTYTLVEHFQTISYPKNKWKLQFSHNIECPECHDVKGHAGIFKKDSNIAYCVLCNKKFIKKFESNFFSFSDKKQTPKDPFSKVRNLFTPTKFPLDLKLSNKVLTDVISLIRNNIPECEEATKLILEARGYSIEDINRMWELGYTYYMPIYKDLFITDGYDVIPFLEKLDSEYKVHVFKKATGLLIPAYYDKQMVGLIMRLDEGIATNGKYITLGVPKKLTRYAEKLQKAYTPKFSYLTDLTVDREVSPIYLVEGFLKGEIAHSYFKSDVVASHGIGNMLNDEIRAFILENRHKEFILIPDRDFSNKRPVANGNYKVLEFLSMIDCNYKILQWKHNNSKIDKTLFKIDDAIVQLKKDAGVEFYFIDKNSFIQKMDRRTRNDYFAGILKNNAVLTEDDLTKLGDLVIVENETGITKPDIFYSLDSRKETWINAFKENKIVVDVSSTGSGKSHVAGTLRLKELGKSFKAIRLVVRSPLNIDVESYKRFKPLLGRNKHGWVYDEQDKKYRLAKAEEVAELAGNCKLSEALTNLQNMNQLPSSTRSICLKCPHFQSCDYLKQVDKNKNLKYTRSVFKSLKVTDNNLVIIDEFSSLDHFSSFIFTENDIKVVLDFVKNNNQWNVYSKEVEKLLFTTVNYIKANKSLTELKEDLFSMGVINSERINSWLEFPEPDKIQSRKIKIQGENIYYGWDKVGSKKINRFFFLLLNILSDRHYGEVYLKPDGNFAIKTINPMFKEIADKSSGVLILDATADKTLLEKVFGYKPLIVSSEGDPMKNVKVTMLEGLPNTYKKSIENPFDNGNSWKIKFKLITSLINKNTEKNYGLITHKTLLDKTNNIFVDERLTTGYFFFHERGSNKFYENNVSTLFSVGIPIPNLNEIGAEVGAKEFEFVYVARPYGPKNKNGKRNYILRKEPANPDLRRYMQYKINSSYIQMVGRLRSLRRPDDNLELVVMDSTPLPFDVDEILLLDKNKRKGIIDLSQDEKEDKIKYIEFYIKTLIEIINTGCNKLNFTTFEKLKEKNLNINNLKRYVKDLDKCESLKEVIKLLQNRKEEILKEFSIQIPVRNLPEVKEM